MSDKRRWPHAEARLVADKLVALLAPACERIIVAGSLRRGKPDVGDVEILYIPKEVEDPAFLFGTMIPAPDLVLEELMENGTLAKRLSIKGNRTWGTKNKLAVHVASGIPVDLFATTDECWHNYLVCRTGPAESNVRIASAAMRLGYRWNPYGSGFTPLRGGGHIGPMTSEREVYEFVGLPVPEWVDPGS